MNYWIYVALTAGLGAVAVAGTFFRAVMKEDPGNDTMRLLMDRIRDGANAFLKAEYRWIAVFVVVMFVVLTFVIDVWGALAYVLGAVLSGSAGVVGMRIATAANARTANAAMEGGAARALPLAFRGGAVMGFTVAGFGLFGLALVFVLASPDLLDVFGYGGDGRQVPFNGYVTFTQTLAAFGLGGSSIALFARIGGGIFTKAADVGADLVGKVEAGIPEDDPRNPATIADNVGDNVGDVAGMGADLFESYVGSMVGPIVLAIVAFTTVGAGYFEGKDITAIARWIDIETGGLVYPLAVAALGILFSFVGTFFVSAKDLASLSRGLHRGPNIAAVLTALSALGLSWAFFRDSEVLQSGRELAIGLTVVFGLVAGVLIGKTSEFFTSGEYGPVRSISQQAETGPATVIIKGIAVGMQSVGISVLLVAAAIVGSYLLGEWASGPDSSLGLYCVALAALGMLSTTAIVVSVDAYGPISDNAGGISEMAGLPPEVRETTDALDALGNTTAAIAKGFAIGSAALTGLALFQAFRQAVDVEGLDLQITTTSTFVGLAIGAMFPFLFASLTMDSVGRAANKMIEEVRRQFRSIPGLREGAPGAEPESARCVEISTKASLREMLIPGALAVAVPILMGIVDVNALGGFLAGSLVTGFCLAIFMANSGGAWDNAKKYIEEGNHGGKGSVAHKAAVVGDTVGDPFKDTSGPSMNILLKVMSIVSLIFVPLFI